MTVDCQKISTIGPRGGRSLVENAVCLRISDLRSRWGWLYALDLDVPDGSTVKLSLDMRGDDAATWVHVEHWPAGARWEADRYTVSLVSRPCRFGGARWRFLDPGGFGLVDALYLPADGTRLASRQAHGLTYRVQRQRAPARAAARVERIRAELGEDGTARPRGMWRSTFARRLALLARFDGSPWRVSSEAVGLPRRLRRSCVSVDPRLSHLTCGDEEFD